MHVRVCVRPAESALKGGECVCLCVLRVLEAGLSVWRRARATSLFCACCTWPTFGWLRAARPAIRWAEQLSGFGRAR